MSKQTRTLDSFAKADLITLIRRRLYSDPTPDLIWIEYGRVTAECIAQSDALQAQMRACVLPRDWGKYKALMAQDDALQKKWDRASKVITA